LPWRRSGSRIDARGGLADVFRPLPRGNLVAMRDVDEQLRILRRGVEAIVPEDDFLKKLQRSVAEDIPLRVKYGIDPTGINVHLGHTVPLRKLRQFQELGHTAVIILGNYTALVGDPSGRDETRTQLTPAKVAENAKDYLRQVGRIIDIDRAEVHENGSWFSKWSFLQVLDLTRQMTLSQITTRDDFAKRMAAERPVYLHECLYPLMQGWDSVEVRADIELGGSEQLFSFMVARDLQKSRGQEPQAAVTMPILVGTDGVRKMSKSYDNYVGVTDEPAEMFGKLMSIPDDVMSEYYLLLLGRELDSSAHPNKAKRALAREIVERFHSAADAESAEARFDSVHKHRVVPDDIPEHALDGDTVHLPALLATAFGISSSEGRRLITQGGVKLEGKALAPDALDVSADDLRGRVLQLGKRRFVRLR